jgi:molybdate-binding protein
VGGYGTVVHGHTAVERAKASGAADAGVSTAAIAAAYGIGFVPLRSVRYDLALRKACLSGEPAQLLLDTLGTRRVRAQLAVAGGFDTSHTGEIVAEVAASG